MQAFSMCVAAAFVVGLVTGQLIPDLSATPKPESTVLFGPAEGYTGNDRSYGMIETNYLRYGMLDDAKVWGVIRVDSNGAVRLAVNRGAGPSCVEIPGSPHELVYYIQQRSEQYDPYQDFVAKKRSNPVMAPHPGEYVAVRL